MLLARAKAASVTPFLRAMVIKVSPGATMCTFSALRGGFAAGGAGAAGAWIVPVET